MVVMAVHCLRVEVCQVSGYKVTLLILKMSGLIVYMIAVSRAVLL